MEQRGEDIAQVGQLEPDDIGAHSAVKQKNMEQVGKRNQHCRDVAENADLLCKLPEPALEGAVALLQLYLAADLAEKGCISDRCNQHFPAARSQVAAAEQGAGVRRFLPVPGGAAAPRKLLHLAALSRHGRLVDLHGAADQEPVGGNAFAGAEQHRVAAHHVRNGNFHNAARAPYPAGRAVALLRKPRKRPLGGTLGKRGDQRGEKDGKPDPGGLDPVGSVKQKQEIHRQSRQQDADDGIVEIAEKLPPEGLGLLLGELVGAVRLTRRANLCIGQSCRPVRGAGFAFQLLNHRFTPMRYCVSICRTAPKYGRREETAEKRGSFALLQSGAPREDKSTACCATKAH